MVKYAVFKTIRTMENVRTPKELYNELNAEFHFDFDPCPADPTFDGLKVEWGHCNYVNPPWDQKRKWIEKAVEEYRKGKCVVLVLPADTSTRWFHELLVPNAAEIRFIKGRMKWKEGAYPSQFPTMVVVLKP